MNFRKVRGTRLYENVVNQIFELIAKGQLSPGLQLPPERTLSEQLGVSRNILREAFRALELRGIVVSVPGGRRFIRPDNVGDAVDIRGLILRLEHPTVVDILESRELIETQAAALAVGRITPADARALREAARRLDTWEDNRDFHLTLAEATHNIMLPKLVRLHLDLLGDLDQRGHYRPERARPLLRQHVGIAEAVIEGDVVKARVLMRRHFRQTRQFMGLNGARRIKGAS
jgi:DNA-binding FadR family transcriptional regulator